MKKNNILIVLAPDDILPKELLQYEEVDTVFMFQRGRSLWTRLQRRFFLLLGLESFALTKEIRNIDLNQYDAIFVNETIYPEKILAWIRKGNNKCTLFYWLWNTVFSEKVKLYNREKELKKVIDSQKSLNYRIVSFDKKDCEKYGFIYNDQVAPFIYTDNIDSRNIKDVFFCGKDKGRLEVLKKIAKDFDNSHISYDFWIVPQKDRIYDSDSKRFLKHSFLEYEELIKREKASKCILEIVQKGQGGITWRALESLFYKRKLITNFSSIVEYDFYNKENIFIIGKDDIHRLKDFVESPYVNIDEQIVQHYLFKDWINRLI